MKTLLTILLLTLLQGTATADELGKRQAIKDIVISLFHTGSFAELNGLAEQYLENEERTPSGTWKLTFFYRGLSDSFQKDITSPRYWEDLEKKAQQWVRAYPEKPMGHLVYADVLLSRAWMYRGLGWGSQVRDEDWKPFREYVSKAKDYLDANKTLASKDPQWFELMLGIAKAEGWQLEEFIQLVDEATKRYPYYYQIYFDAVDYLTPRWHGSAEEIEKFAQKAVALTYDREKTSLYARIYWSAEHRFQVPPFAQSLEKWKRMSQSIDHVLELYPAQWNINNFALFACQAGDLAKTRELMAQIEGKPLIRIWKTNSNYNYCKAWSSSKKRQEQKGV